VNWSSGNTEDKQVQTIILDTAAHGWLNTFAPPTPTPYLLQNLSEFVTHYIGTTQSSSHHTNTVQNEKLNLVHATELQLKATLEWKTKANTWQNVRYMGIFKKGKVKWEWTVQGKSHEQQTKSTNYYKVQVIHYVIIWNSHDLNFTVLHLIQNNVVTCMYNTNSIWFYSIFSSNTQWKWWDNQIEISTVNLFTSIQFHIKYLALQKPGTGCIYVFTWPCTQFVSQQ
jgi:hypothetical protein